MRTIHVRDAARSALFYGDVLGFDVRDEAGTVEAVYGPARLEFSGLNRAPAVLFLQTADVGKMREIISGRGGLPSQIEKVNWIKMEMFEIRDPDGNILWFGQSYDEPCGSKPEPQLSKALPGHPVASVGAAVEWYRDVLGFRVNYQQDDLGVMDRDRVTLVLIPRSEPHTGLASTYIYVGNADGLHAELRAGGASVQGEPISHPWGLRDFAVLDPDGNRITFGQPFE